MRILYYYANIAFFTVPLLLAPIKNQQNTGIQIGIYI